jgi:twitching motility protein PilT
MRDLETIEAAMTIAETGHLVFGTLHTNTAIGSINRIIDVFPPHQQAQIRAQLSMTLMAVITQTLVPKMDGPGRVMIQEIMIPNAAIRNLIREDKVHQIYSAMLTGQGVSGMQTMNQALFLAYQKRQISEEDAMGRSPEPNELASMIAGGSPTKPGQS